MKKKAVYNKSSLHLQQEALPASTTLEEQTVSAGQRTVNLIWENTQSNIAKATVYSGIFINIFVIVTLIVLRKEVSTTMVVVVLASLASMNTTTGIIIGFYFSRTNHSNIGGVGKKETLSIKGTR